MHFGLSDDETEFVASIHTMLERRSDSQAVRAAMTSEVGYDSNLWQEIGAASLSIPEEFGGDGFGAFTMNLVLEELGYSLAPSPALGSAVAAAQAILLSGDSDACERLLPQLAEGTLGCLAWANEDGQWLTDGSDIRASESDGWHLDGRATLVLDGSDAEIVIAVAQTDGGVGLFEVITEAGVERIRTPALDPTMRFADILFTRAEARPLALDAGPILSRLRDRLLVAVSALQVGTARRGLDMTVRYSKERVQFGRQIGSFQALKHRMADMLVQVETARTVSWAASWAVETEADDLSAQAAFAKAWCSEALDRVASDTVQLHGGIAITWEHDAQLVFKRAHALGQLFGQAAGHRRRLAELRGLGAI